MKKLRNTGRIKINQTIRFGNPQNRYNNILIISMLRKYVLCIAYYVDG